MFNRSLKKSAIENYERAVWEYDKLAGEVQGQATDLHQLREQSSSNVIASCQAFVNKLANSPKEFQASISEFEIEYAKFSELLAELQRENAKHEAVSGSVVGAGAALGVGVAAFAPTAAMAVATTFGVASTGTAISTLSGAAATKAALAWLGGGALAAGGGGIAGGSALLALAGPVGWTIGGLGLAVGGYTMSKKNAEVAEKATQATIKVEAGSALLRTAGAEIQRLLALTTEHVGGVTKQLQWLLRNAPFDYANFSEEDKLSLAALINNVRSLSQLLNQKVA